MTARRLAAAATLAAAVLLAACAPAATPAPSATPAASFPASPVTGVLVSVDSSGLADVRGFRLRLADGRILDFTIGTLENGDQFPPGHLTEHLATASPVKVSFRVENGALVVYRLDDGG